METVPIGDNPCLWCCPYPAVMALMQRGYFLAEDLVTDRIGLDYVLRTGLIGYWPTSQIKIMVGP